MPSAQLYPQTSTIRYGGWLPHSKDAYEKFFRHLNNKAATRRRAKSSHIQAVGEFEDAIRADPEMLGLFEQTFLQAATPQNHVEDFDCLLHFLDIILVQPPSFIENDIGEPIGVPIYIVFDLLSNTAAAYQLFSKPAFNVAMKKLLDSWGAFLSSPGSNTTLTDKEGGWFSDEGIKTLEDKGRGDFDTTYIHPKPDEVNRGYESWNEFFIREIKDEARPIVSDGNPANIISACESAVLRLDRNVKAHDQFWLKAQKYSLYGMLDRDESTTQYFTGGTVYQAFLSPYDYHRWRAPVSGTVVKADIIPGTYYAVLPDEGAEEGDPDFEPGAPYGALIRSQAWLTQSATRAIILIDTGNPKIGIVGFIGVGMVEVSTCVLSVEAGRKVQQGEEIGMFQFGGSTHVLLFGPDVKLTFVEDVEKDGVLNVNNHIKVRSLLAQVN